MKKRSSYHVKLYEKQKIFSLSLLTFCQTLIYMVIKSWQAKQILAAIGDVTVVTVISHDFSILVPHIYVF